mgnify:CR=1 FL=1
MNREQSIEFIQAIEDTKALERAILDIIDELKSEGSKEIADGLEQLIPISNNRFSVIGQKELLQESKRRAISILKSEPQFNHVSEKEACCIVERVLGNVQLYLQDGKYKGVGAHLFAIACKHSWDAGNEGYVQFTAKADLIEHYQKTLNAHLLDWHTLYIDSYGASDLIHKYFKER